MRLLKWLVGKFYKTCKCTEPRYEVLEGLLACSICRKPIHRDNWKG